jgi:GMP synthase (glutamine-hydrolysing)
MIAVVENDTDIGAGSFVDDIVRYLPGSRAFDIVREGAVPSLSDVDALVLAGSRAGVYEDDEHDWMRREQRLIADAAEREVPILGICFGHQLVHWTFGGTVEPGQSRNRLVRTSFGDDPLFEGLSPVVPVLHSDYVVEAAAGFETIATAEYYDAFATRHESLPIWTVQFHPEYTPRLSPLVDEWTETEWSFDDCNATDLFGNFHRLVAAATPD